MTSNPMEELREQAAKIAPCPFCGGEARLEIGKAAFEDAEVSCNGCAASTGNYDDGFGRDDNSRLAIDAWNARPLPAPVAMPQAEEVEDAYGRTGEREDCMSCGGKGTEYGETCLTCGGYGWVNNPPTPTETPTAAAPDDGLMGRYREALREIAKPIHTTDSWRLAAIRLALIAAAALSTATGDEGGK